MAPRNYRSTAVPWWGQTTHDLSGVSPKRDYSSERVNVLGHYPRASERVQSDSYRVQNFWLLLYYGEPS